MKSLVFSTVIFSLAVSAGPLRGQEPEGGAEPPSEATRRRRSHELPFETGVVPGTTAQPGSSIAVDVRYEKDYGYESDGTTLGGGPSSCQAFSVSATTERPQRPDAPVGLERNEQMSDVGDAYVCHFRIFQLPLDERISVEVGFLEREGPTRAWRGGSEAEPPSGWVRAIRQPTRTVTLTESEPRATLVFEMVYAPTGDLVAPRPKSDGIFRQP